eukprot:jgi/Orpsp1_1/1191154/evm.model.d7180000083829.1
MQRIRLFILILLKNIQKYISPIWFGVSYCGNNTVVNNVGRYFACVGDNENNRSSDDYEINSGKIIKVNDQNNDKNNDNSKKKKKKKKKKDNDLTLE